MIELEYLNLKIYLLKDWSREIFIVNKINDTVPYTYNLKDLNGEEILGSFYDRELQKTRLQCMYKTSSKYFPPYEVLIILK